MWAALIPSISFCNSENFGQRETYVFSRGRALTRRWERNWVEITAHFCNICLQHQLSEQKHKQAAGNKPLSPKAPNFRQEFPKDVQHLGQCNVHVYVQKRLHDLFPLYLYVGSPVLSVTLLLRKNKWQFRDLHPILCLCNSWYSQCGRHQRGTFTLLVMC